MRFLFPLKCLVAIAVAMSGEADPQPPKQPTPPPAKAVMAPAARAATAEAPSAPVPPDFDLPDEIKGEVGAFIPIRPKTKGKYIVYYPLDAGLQVFPSEMLANKTQTVVSSARAGRYRLLAYTAVGNIPSLPVVATIVVGIAPTPPPSPNPNPPPAPVPDIESDPLWPSVRAAYLVDAPSTGPEKVRAAAVYAAYYRSASKAINAYDGSSEDAMWQQVQGVESASSINLQHLVGVRAILKREIDRLRPIPLNDPTIPSLTADVKKQIADCYLRFAALLEGASK